MIKPEIIAWQKTGSFCVALTWGKLHLTFVLKKVKNIYKAVKYIII